MFLINSRQGLVTATKQFELLGTPSPEVTGHFAEFLRESYLAPLGILYQPTCVGLRYRYLMLYSSASFSWKYDSQLIHT